MINMEWSPQSSPSVSGRPPITAILTHPQAETTVCSVTGAVDWTTASVMRNALTEARHDDNSHLVIDLSAVTSMDSAGPYTLLEARFKHYLHGGGCLAVVLAPQSRAIPELQVVALQAAFDVHPTLTDALHACADADIRSASPNMRARGIPPSERGNGRSQAPLPQTCASTCLQGDDLCDAYDDAGDGGATVTAYAAARIRS
jgi:anti-anti-sigma factor